MRHLNSVAFAAVVALAAVCVPASALAAPPSNDYFANATDAYDGLTDMLSTLDATVQANEPESPCGQASHSVWYRYVSSAEGGFHVDTVGSDYDTLLTEYQGTSLASLAELNCDDNSGGGLASRLDIAVTPGRTYYFQVGSVSADGGTLAFAFVAKDGQAPTVTKPLPQIVEGSTFGQGSTVVRWTGSDRGSGLARFDLQRAFAGGAWHSVALSHPTDTSAHVALPLATKVQFRVRGTDNAGNTSGWKLGPRFTPIVYQDHGSSVTYSAHWHRIADANASGGTRTYSKRAGARATLAFTGRSVALISTLSPSRGVAKIYLDGVLAGTRDLYIDEVKTEERNVVFAFNFPWAETHVIEVVVKGTLHRPQVDVDAFLVLR